MLSIYWLVSGYGLRAWRSLAALAVVIAGLAMAFYLVGFTHSISYWKSLLFAFRSTLSLTDASVNLTACGGFFQAILRLTGEDRPPLHQTRLQADSKRPVLEPCTGRNTGCRFSPRTLS